MDLVQFLTDVFAYYLPKHMLEAGVGRKMFPKAFLGQGKQQTIFCSAYVHL